MQAGRVQRQGKKGAVPPRPRAPAAPPRPAAPRLRPPHEAVHEKLIEEYKLQHDKEPSDTVWYKLLETAKAQVAAQTVGKRRRVHTALPEGFVAFADS